MKRKVRKIFAAIFIIVTVLASGSFVYGEIYSVRDDMINIELPDSWSIEELDKPRTGAEMDHILYAYEDNDSSFTDLNVYFTVEAADDYIYFINDEQGALDYYDQYGQPQLEEFYSRLDDHELISLSEPEFYDGEWNGFVEVRATVNKDVGGENKTCEELIFLTATESIAHELLIFSGYDSNRMTYTAAQMEATAIPIIEAFYDYNYGAEMLGTNNSHDEGYSGDDDDTYDSLIGLLTILFSIVIVVAVVIAIVKSVKTRKEGGNVFVDGQVRANGRKERMAGSSHKEKWKSMGKALFVGRETGDIFGERLTETGTGEPDPGRGTTELFREKRKRPHVASSEEPHIISSDAGTKYIECLRTLYKSGLLTREELNQMIDKYQNRR